MIDLEAARYHWHPVAASADLIPRHVFQAQILGREMALWRADDGNVNAWENRCLHRGVRLSIGINDGTELVCQYHGWRYANRTAGCTYIPAHPADSPARTVCNNTYPVQEKYGLVWSGETPEGELPEAEILDTPRVTPLRSIIVNAPLESIALPLINRYRSEKAGYLAQASVPYGADTPNPFAILLRAPEQIDEPGAPVPDIAFFLQPMDAARTAIRGLLCGVDQHTSDHTTTTALLKQHDLILCTVRDAIEQKQATLPAPVAWTPTFRTISESQSLMPERDASARQSSLRLRVAGIEQLTHNVRMFRFEPLTTGNGASGSTLAVAQAGAHLDLHLPNGLVRQYSLLNGPGQTDHYAIAVKHLPDSSGGSSTLHTSVKVGDVLATSVPRNNFSLRRDAIHTHLIAGGIGITPMLSMARTLDHSGLPFTLHHFVAQEEDRVFKAELEGFHGRIHTHIAQNATQTRNTIASLLQHPIEKHHVYICGPGPLLDHAINVASENGWPDEAVHFEYFKNTQTVDDSTAFDVELARSGLSLHVPAGKSLLTVLRENNVGVVSSCAQGACGTCRISVLEGEPSHQDVYLSEAEKQRGDSMMCCVSRAGSKRLVLDL